MDFIKKNISLLRLFYPIMILAITIASKILSGYSFIYKEHEIVGTLLYFFIAALYIISIYLFEIKTIDIVILFMLPIAFIFSPLKFEILGLIALLPKIYIIIKRKNKLVFLLVLYLLFTLLGILAYTFIFLIGDFAEETILQTSYSPDNKYRIDIIDSDQGGLGGDTFIKLFDIKFGILEKFDRDIYHGRYGDRPTALWIDSKIVKINENIIIDVVKSEMYENEKHN